MISLYCLPNHLFKIWREYKGTLIEKRLLLFYRHLDRNNIIEHTGLLESKF